MGLFDYNPNGTKLTNSDQLINIGFENTIRLYCPNTFIKTISCKTHIDSHINSSNNYISIFKVCFSINCDEQGNIYRNKNDECIVNVRAYDRFDKMINAPEVYVFGKLLSNVEFGTSIPMRSKPVEFYCSEVETLLNMITPEWCENFVQDNIGSKNITFMTHSLFSVKQI